MNRTGHSSVAAKLRADGTSPSEEAPSPKNTAQTCFLPARLKAYAEPTAVYKRKT